MSTKAAIYDPGRRSEGRRLEDKGVAASSRCVCVCGCTAARFSVRAPA